MYGVPIKSIPAALAALVWVGCLPCAAHMGLHEQITSLSQEIVDNPASCSLYLRRGELYRQHQDWPAALGDYLRAEACDPALEQVALGKGRMYADQGETTKALLCVLPYVDKYPADVVARILCAQLRNSLGQHVESAAEYTASISLSENPTPNLFIERARALAQAGDGYLDEAVRGLDEGIARLGEVITLEQAAADFELNEGRLEAAEARLKKIIRSVPRKDAFLARLGDFYAQTGQTVRAREAYTSAALVIASLPERHKSTTITRELLERLKVNMGALTSGTETVPRH